MAASLFFKHRRLMLVLPRQYGGKTELGCRLGVDIVSRPTTKSGLFLAKDHPSAKKATREKFIRLADSAKFAVNTQQIYLKKHVTSTLYIGSVDKEPDRLRGGTYAFIHWSEVAFSKIEKGETITSIFDKIIKPTLSLQDGYVLLESTLNGKNDFYNLWENYKEHGLFRLKIGLGQMVEMGVISQELYDLEKARYHPDVFNQEYECEWVSFLGKAYTEFNDSHIEAMPDPEPWQQVLFAIDWGFSPSATCVLFAYVIDDVLNVFDEHYKMEETPIETAFAIETRRVEHDTTRMVGVADHDPARIVELTRRGIACANADKANVMGARMQIKEALYFNKIKIHPRCAYLRRDLEAAAWDGKHDGELDYSQFSWGHGDAESALRYLIRMLSGSEAEKPEENPNDSYDEASARAYRINKRTDW